MLDEKILADLINRTVEMRREATAEEVLKERVNTDEPILLRF